MKSPHLDDLIPESIAKHREWASVYLNTFVQAFNTNPVKKEGLPNDPSDLLNSRNGGASSPSRRRTTTGSRRSCSASARRRASSCSATSSATNGLSVRKGHTLLANLVAAGEVPLALTVYGFSAEQIKQKGAPLDWFIIPPLIARPTAAGVARNAPHPHAAVLFL